MSWKERKFVKEDSPAHIFPITNPEGTRRVGNEIRIMKEPSPSSVKDIRLGDGDGRKEGSRHAYSPSNSGKTVEKPSVIHTRR